MKSVTVSIVPHLSDMKWWDPMPWYSFFECWVLIQVFHSPLSLSFFFAFFHKGGITCISEVIDISPCNLDSSLCFFQPGISHALHRCWISRVKIYSLDVLFAQFGSSPLFHVRFHVPFLTCLQASQESG